MTSICRKANSEGNPVWIPSAFSVRCMQCLMSACRLQHVQPGKSFRCRACHCCADQYALPQYTIFFAGRPHQTQVSERCSCRNGIQRLVTPPSSSLIAFSQATSPHHIALMKPGFVFAISVNSSFVAAV